MKHRFIVKFILFLIVSHSLLFLFSCGFYSFSGSLAPHLKTIAIPLFEDRTAEYGIKENLTDTIIEEFTRDNTLKIAERSDADILLTGSIVSVDDRTGALAATTQQYNVQEIKVYITVNVKCEDLVKRNILWEDRLTQWGSYEPDVGPDARNEAINEAISKLSTDILNKTVAGW